MYKYFKELDNPNDFTTLYKNDNLPERILLFQQYLKDLPTEVLENLKYVLTNLSVIDLLVSKLQFILIPDEKQNEYYDFQNYQGDNEPFLETIKKKIDVTNNDLLDLLSIYKKYISYMIYFYPEHKDFLNGLNERTKKAIKFIETKSWIEIPVKPIEQVIWPNNWYITPNGYLYNACTGGKKSGSLYWTLYTIFGTLKENKSVIEKFNEHIAKLSLEIRNIENRKFVTVEQFFYYTDFTRFPSSEIPGLQVLDNSIIYDLENNTTEVIIGICCQKNIKTIVLGYLNAQLSLYEYYLQLYKQISSSPNYPDLIGNLGKNESDRLLKFCGFHRIEPSLRKTITTSSIDNISNFSAYEEKGWTIKTIPPIKYDEEEDTFIEKEIPVKVKKNIFIYKQNIPQI